MLLMPFLAVCFVTDWRDVPRHDPNCEHCVAARGVKHHRRRHADGSETCEIFADLLFSRCSGGSQAKVLVMVDPVTSAVSYVHVGQNVSKYIYIYK